MLREINLKNVGPGEELSFTFNERYNLLTGDNGVGKSFILDVAWWAVAFDWIEHAPARRQNADGKGQIDCRFLNRSDNSSSSVYGVEIPTSLTRKVNGAVRDFDENLPLTVFADSGGNFSVFDPVRHLPESGLNNPTQPFEFNVESEHFSSRELWNGLERQGAFISNGLIRDVVTWQLEKSRPFEILTNVLATLSPSENEKLQLGSPERFELQDARRVPTLNTTYGNVPLPLASAAVRQIVGIAYILVWAIEEHLIFAEKSEVLPNNQLLLLIDEVEAHLHPRWQRRILRALNEAILDLPGRFDCQIIAVTHSPLVLSSLETVFDPEKDALFNLEVDGNNVTAKQLDWRAHGDVGSWLTSEVFNLGEARSLEAEEAMENARATALNSDATPEDFKAAHDALQRVLGDTDPFWVKWVARAERAGLKL